ncbi:MAG: DNRLRE domain-containing protein [Bacteroidota bacterium]
MILTVEGDDPVCTTPVINDIAAVCDGFTATITISATGDGPLEYSIGNGFQDSNVFTGLAGNATFSVIVREKNLPGCTASQQVNTPDCATLGSEITLSAIHDAYLQNGVRFNNNVLRIEEGSRERISYLQFDLSQVDATIVSAQLVLNVPNNANNGDAGSGLVKVFKGDSNNWTEDNLTPNNAPAQGMELGSLNQAYNLGQQNIAFNLNPVGLMTGDLNSFVVVSDAGGSQDIAFGSSENIAAFQPQLVLVVEGGSAPTQLELCPQADAYLQNGTPFNNSVIRLENGSRQRVGYLQYDMTGIAQQITGARLELTVPNAANQGDQGSGEIEVFQGSNAMWTEMNLSSGNAPTAQGNAIGSINETYSFNETISIELDPTDFLNNPILNLVLQTNATAGNDVAFGSSENLQAACPTLILELGDTVLLAKQSPVSKASFGSETRLEMYPNPASEQVQVRFKDAASGSLRLVVKDLSGRIMLQKVMDKDNEEVGADLMTRDLAEGIYLVETWLNGERKSIERLSIRK